MPTPTAPTSVADLSTTIIDNHPDSATNLPSSIGNTQRTAFAFIRQMVSEGTAFSSAPSITIPNNGQTFSVLNSTAISTINPSWQGRIVYLEFPAASPPLINQSASINLGQSSYQTVQGDVIAFQYRGTQWRALNLPRVWRLATGTWAQSLAGTSTLMSIQSSSLTPGIILNGNALRAVEAGVYSIICTSANISKTSTSIGYFSHELRLNGVASSNYGGYEYTGTQTTVPGIQNQGRYHTLTANTDIQPFGNFFGLSYTANVSLQILRVS
ncbi:MAG: hypothetical protein ACRCVX_08480 [Shewanella sp.]